MRLLIKWLLIAAVIYYLPFVIPGIIVQSYVIALVFALILTILHYTLRPILFVLTLPINILTLGLFSIVLNTAMFGLAAYLIEGFDISGFWSALFGVLIVSLCSSIIDSLLRPSNSH